MRKKIIGVVLVSLLLLLGACQRANEASSTPTSVTEEVFLGTCGKAEGPLRLYMWYEEVVPEVLEEFGTLHGIEVSYETYSSNEELLDTLGAGETAYDLVF